MDEIVNSQSRILLNYLWITTIPYFSAELFERAPDKRLIMFMAIPMDEFTYFPYGSHEYDYLGEEFYSGTISPNIENYENTLS